MKEIMKDRILEGTLLAVVCFAMTQLGCDPECDSSADCSPGHVCINNQCEPNATGDTDVDVDTDNDSDTDSDSDTETDTDVEIYAEWIELDPGSFWMGSPDGDCPPDYPEPGPLCVEELGRYDFEALHYVNLTNSFEIMMTEVTQNDFYALMSWNPSYYGPSGNGEYCGSDCPVESVNWYEAAAFANMFSLYESLTPCYTMESVQCVDASIPDPSTDYMQCINSTANGISSAIVELNGVSTPYECTGYRIPTESEWEYAVRAGDLTAFYTSDGNDGSITEMQIDPNLEQIAWYYGNSDTGLGQMTQPVASKPANAWGLHDMIGNVLEWVWDPREEAYPEGDTYTPVQDPAGGDISLPWRSFRGGGWFSYASQSRSAFRNAFGPETRSDERGFRLSRTIL